MSNYSSILPEVMLLLTLTAIFVILFVTVLKIVRGVSFFQGKTAVIMALCVSVLCVVGLLQFLVVPGGTYNATEANMKITVTVSYLLLPQVALASAIAVIFSQLLLFASRILPGERPKARVKEPERPRTKSKSSGKPKKAKPAEKQSKEVACTAGEKARKGEGLS